MRSMFWNGTFYLVLFATMTLPAYSGRAIRALAFRKGSSFFYRLNYKINSLPFSTIFAQAAGFKAAWQLPTSYSGLRVVRSVPSIREHAELVYESHGFNGRSCLLKSVCQMSQHTSGQDGVIRKILKLLVRSYMNNDTWHEDSLSCERHAIDCPLQLIGLNGFAENAA